MSLWKLGDDITEKLATWDYNFGEMRHQTKLHIFNTKKENKHRYDHK